MAYLGNNNLALANASVLRIPIFDKSESVSFSFNTLNFPIGTFGDGRAIYESNTTYRYDFSGGYLTIGKTATDQISFKWYKPDDTLVLTEDHSVSTASGYYVSFFTMLMAAVDADNNIVGIYSNVQRWNTGSDPNGDGKTQLDSYTPANNTVYPFTVNTVTRNFNYNFPVLPVNTLTEITGGWYVPPTDPYADGGYSGDGGGDGSFNLQNDSIDFPSLPTLSAVDTGLVSIYTPSLAQLKSLATFLWNANPTDVDWWKKLVANPLDLILGLSIVPVQVPAGSAQTIKVGLIDTGVSVTKAASQFVTVDCGSVTIQKNCGGSALDYSPFTKFSLYLPFIGTRTISCDDIMGRTVHVKYNVDLLSGGCTAMVKITGGPDDNQLDAILYQYSGACAISIPLTGETFTNMITSTIQLAASIGATVATGGAASGITAASAANSLMSMKPIIERAGGVSGAAGQLGIMQPYLIAEVPRQSVPENCNAFTGYPSNMKATIGDLTGYTEVDIIYLKGIEATQAELDELESVLKGGFII